jgi:glycosyltransferase involved in cell wall biosynthesis
MKILFVIDAFENPHAGTEGQLYRLLSELGRGGYEPHLLVFRESQYLRQGGFPCDYTVLGGSASIRSAQTWRQLSSFAKRFKSQGYHLAHVFFNDASVLCPPVFRLVGIRTIISRRDMGYWYTAGYRWALRLTRHFVSGVLANSEAVKGITMENEWYRDNQVSVIYNGYSVPGETSVASMERPAGWPVGQDDALTICLVANVRPIKRIQDAIEGIARLRSSASTPHLVVIGGGEPDGLVKLAKQRGVSEHVHFLGSRTDVAQCLLVSDIGLLCSESEGFSNAIVEYMLAGLPVVCTNTGGNPEAVIDNETGYLYPVGDVAALADRLAKLAANEEQRRAFGQRARERASERFSVEAMMDAHKNYYLSLLSGKG